MSLKIASIFTSQMVLQRDCNIPIWGSSDGEKVILNLCQETVESKVVDGNWFVYFSPKKAGGPFELTISSETETLVLRQVYIGDVFIAGGQSNMEFELQKTLNGEVAVNNANDPFIHYYQVPKIEFEDPNQTPKSSWTVCSKETAGLYSAVAYHFAKNLDENIPIGIIGCNWGGTSASCWMSREYLENHEEIKCYIDDYDQEVSQYTKEEYEQRRLDFIKSQQDHWEMYCKFKEENPNVPEHLVTSHIGDWPWPPPVGPKSFLRPAGVYYTMLKKITPYACKAVLWYQGESDTHRPKLYDKLFSKMIENWRKDFQNPNLPFLFVQLPGFANGNQHNLEYAFLRESQLKVAKTVPNTHMIVSIDCGDKDDIHPIDKEPIGKRLAVLAKRKLYNQDVIYSGPMIRDVLVEGQVVKLSFDHLGSGLVILGDEIKGFKLSGEDLIFKDCKASLNGDHIILSSDEIQKPVYVRYGFENYPNCNVYNKEGLPLCPFRTDCQ